MSPVIKKKKEMYSKSNANVAKSIAFTWNAKLLDFLFLVETVEDCTYAFSFNQPCLYDRHGWSTGRKEDKGVERAKSFSEGRIHRDSRVHWQICWRAKRLLDMHPSLGPSAMQDPCWASTAHAWHDVCIFSLRWLYKTTRRKCYILTDVSYFSAFFFLGIAILYKQLYNLPHWTKYISACFSNNISRETNQRNSRERKIQKLLS